MNKLYKLTIIAIIVVGLAYIAWCFMVINDVARSIPFDHSQCQYPYRESNPPDGCDNTDPAEPIKAVKWLPETEPEVVVIYKPIVEIKPEKAIVNNCR